MSLRQHTQICSLLGCLSATGANLQFLAAVHALLTVNTTTITSLTIYLSQFSDINAWSLDSLIVFEANNVLLDGLVSTAYNSSWFLLTTASSRSNQSSSLVVQNSSFSRAQQSALAIASYSSATFTNTHFDQAWYAVGQGA